MHFRFYIHVTPDEKPIEEVFTFSTHIQKDVQDELWIAYLSQIPEVEFATDTFQSRLLLSKNIWLNQPLQLLTLYKTSVLAYQWRLRIPSTCQPSHLYPLQRAIYLSYKHPSLDDQSLQFYWSFDSDGDSVLSEIDLASFGVGDSSFNVTRFALAYEPRPYWVRDAILEFYNLCGFDPLSSDLAGFIGVPRVEILSDLSGKRLKSFGIVRSH